MVGEKKIPEGYKETEIGIIPNEWIIKHFSDICTINQGLQIAIEKRNLYPSKNSKKYITIQFLAGGKRTEYIDNYNEAVCCYKDDILMTRTGNTGIVVTGVTGVFHNNFFKINYNTKLINKQYLVYYLKNKKIQQMILDRAGTSTIPDLNHKDFYSLPVTIPDINEQKVIATALSDIDDLILSLEKLIDKKNLIKQGTMQELLTGKKRLDGFNGEWKYIKLRSLVEYIKGYAFRSKDYKNSGIRIIRISDTTFNYIHDNNAIYIDKKYCEDYSQWQLKEDDIIISTVGSKPPMYDSIVGKAILIDKKYSGSFLNQNSVLLRSKICNNKFIYYNLRSYKYMKHIEKIFRGNANQASINLEELFEFEIFIPNSLKEQTAIANILSYMDAEIKKLEIKLDKYRNIKRGMMEELLTGKRRLI